MATIFRCIFLNENVWILIKISTKFVPKGPINNIPALVQIVSWCRTGDKPLSEAMMAKFATHICVTRPQCVNHDDVIKWKHFPRYWPFVRGIHRSTVNSPHKGQWRRALMFSLICVWINGWVNNREAGDSRRYHVHYDVTVMQSHKSVEETRKVWYHQHQAKRTLSSYFRDVNKLSDFIKKYTSPMILHVEFHRGQF